MALKNDGFCIRSRALLGEGTPHPPHACNDIAMIGHKGSSCPGMPTRDGLHLVFVVVLSKVNFSAGNQSWSSFAQSPHRVQTSLPFSHIPPTVLNLAVKEQDREASISKATAHASAVLHLLRSRQHKLSPRHSSGACAHSQPRDGATLLHCSQYHCLVFFVLFNSSRSAFYHQHHPQNNYSTVQCLDAREIPILRPDTGLSSTH